MPPVAGIHPEAVLAHLAVGTAEEMVAAIANRQISTQKGSDDFDRLFKRASRAAQQFHVLVAQYDSHEALYAELPDDSVADDVFSGKCSNYRGRQQETSNFDEMLQLLIFVVVIDDAMARQRFPLTFQTVGAQTDDAVVVERVTDRVQKSRNKNFVFFALKELDYITQLLIRDFVTASYQAVPGIDSFKRIESRPLGYGCVPGDSLHSSRTTGVYAESVSAEPL